jgi:hypothetical protein
VCAIGLSHSRAPSLAPLSLSLSLSLYANLVAFRNLQIASPV